MDRQRQLPLPTLDSPEQGGNNSSKIAQPGHSPAHSGGSFLDAKPGSDFSANQQPHRLQERFAPLSSVSINMSYRIVLEIPTRHNDIILIDVGHHDQVYRSD